MLVVASLLLGMAGYHSIAGLPWIDAFENSVPIMALHNVGSLALPNGLRLARPFHLMEGHHRFGYLRAMSLDRTRPPQSQHSLWLITPDTALVRRYWPMNFAPDS